MDMYLNSYGRKKLDEVNDKRPPAENVVVAVSSLAVASPIT